MPPSGRGSPPASVPASSVVESTTRYIHSLTAFIQPLTTTVHQSHTSSNMRGCHRHCRCTLSLPLFADARTLCGVASDDAITISKHHQPERRGFQGEGPRRLSHPDVDAVDRVRAGSRAEEHLPVRVAAGKVQGKQSKRKGAPDRHSTSDDGSRRRRRTGPPAEQNYRHQHRRTRSVTKGCTDRSTLLLQTSAGAGGGRARSRHSPVLATHPRRLVLRGVLRLSLPATSPSTASSGLWLQSQSLASTASLRPTARLTLQDKRRRRPRPDDEYDDNDDDHDLEPASSASVPASCTARTTTPSTTTNRKITQE